MDFPNSSVGKESACNAGVKGREVKVVSIVSDSLWHQELYSSWNSTGQNTEEEVYRIQKPQDPASIPGSGRFAGEEIDYPFQYSWASLVAQLVKNLPAMWETWVGEIPWRRERLPTLVFWPGKFQVHGVAESDMTEWFSLHFT